MIDQCDCQECQEEYASDFYDVVNVVKGIVGPAAVHAVEEVGELVFEADLDIKSKESLLMSVFASSLAISINDAAKLTPERHQDLCRELRALIARYASVTQVYNG